jgi:hypothetical protein
MTFLQNRKNGVENGGTMHNALGALAPTMKHIYFYNNTSIYYLMRQNISINFLSPRKIG